MRARLTRHCNTYHINRELSGCRRLSSRPGGRDCPLIWYSAYCAEVLALTIPTKVMNQIFKNNSNTMRFHNNIYLLDCFVHCKPEKFR